MFSITLDSRIKCTTSSAFISPRVLFNVNLCLEISNYCHCITIFSLLNFMSLFLLDTFFSSRSNVSPEVIASDVTDMFHFCAKQNWYRRDATTVSHMVLKLTMSQYFRVVRFNKQGNKHKLIIFLPCK